MSPSRQNSQPSPGFDERSRDLWGGITLFAATARGSRTFVIGDHTDAFASMVRWFGGEVVCREWDHEVESADETSTPLVPLPFGESEFDTLFLSGVLEWSGRWANGGERPQQARERLLRECMRVLRPGGILLALVDNRFSIVNWGGKRHPTTGIRGFEILPRGLIPLLPPKLRQQARYFQSESYTGWGHSFRRAGFTLQNWRTLWPSKTEWNHVATLSALPAQALAGASAAHKEVLADSLLRGLQRLGMHHLASPNYLITARKPSIHPEIPEPRPLSDELLVAEGESADAEIIVTTFNNSKSFAFIAGNTFFKIPVTSHSVRSADKEVRANRMIAEHPVSKHVPGPVRLGQVRGVHYLACPAIKVDAARRIDERHLKDVLDLLGHGAQQTSLCQTQFWQRCFHPKISSRIGVLGGEPALHFVQHNLADRQVSVGLVHGDLHIRNILLGKDHIYIIDWNRLEEKSPRFIDLMELVTSFLMDRVPALREEVLEALEILLVDDARASVLHRIHDWVDELSITEMAICYLLNYASLQCSERAPSSSDQRWFQPWFSFCERALESSLHEGERVRGR